MSLVIEHLKNLEKKIDELTPDEIKKIIERMGPNYSGYDLLMAKLRIAELKSALKGLMDAYKEIFNSSIYMAFMAEQTKFLKAWKKAVEVLK